MKKNNFYYSFFFSIFFYFLKSKMKKSFVKIYYKNITIVKYLYHKNKYLYEGIKLF